MTLPAPSEDRFQRLEGVGFQRLEGVGFQRLEGVGFQRLEGVGFQRLEGVTLWRQIAATLQQEIANGTHPPGGRLRLGPGGGCHSRGPTGPSTRA